MNEQEPSQPKSPPRAEDLDARIELTIASEPDIKDREAYMDWIAELVSLGIQQGVRDNEARYAEQERERLEGLRG